MRSFLFMMFLVSHLSICSMSSSWEEVSRAEADFARATGFDVVENPNAQPPIELKDLNKLPTQETTQDDSDLNEPPAQQVMQDNFDSNKIEIMAAPEKVGCLVCILRILRGN